MLSGALTLQLQWQEKIFANFSKIILFLLRVRMMVGSLKSDWEDLASEMNAGKGYK